MAKLSATQKKWFEYMALMLELHHDNGVRFDLSSWISPNKKEEDWCGTSGCACGLAALNPTFNQAGFKTPYTGARQFVYNGNTGWGAVRAFFNISQVQAQWLFSGTAYKGQTYGDKAARKVARRIREFIASNGEVPKTFTQEVFS